MSATATCCGEVTTIALDHQEYLGATLSAIAFEKAGIFKPGVPAVSSRQPPEVLEVLEKVAREVGAPFHLEGRDFFFEPEPGEVAVELRSPRPSLPRVGYVLGVSAMVLFAFLARDPFALGPEAARHESHG